MDFELFLTLIPPLSAAPQPPTGIEIYHKKVLRHMGSGLKKVEKLKFLKGFEPCIALEPQKLIKK